jgi:hypothetical protein
MRVAAGTVNLRGAQGLTIHMKGRAVVEPAPSGISNQSEIDTGLKVKLYIAGLPGWVSITKTLVSTSGRLILAFFPLFILSRLV